MSDFEKAKENHSCIKTSQILGLGLVIFVSSVAAQETNKPKRPTSTSGNSSAAEIAKESHNPLGNLREVIFQTDILPNVGPSKKTEVVETIQTVYPFSLGNSWKVMTYGIIPVVSQPRLSSRDDRTSGLGDSTFFGYFVPPNEGKLIWGFGPALQVPTATGDILGSDKWAAGPALIVGVQPGNWSIFGLFDNVWDFAGPGDEQVNEFTFQYQAVYLFPKDWYFITNWTIDADWTESSENRWTVPIGGGFGRQFTIGKQIFQAYGQMGYNVARPDGASKWRGIAAVSLIF
jgi:hypothetical protein